MLRYAHEIELLEVVPKVKLLKVAPPRFDFLTFEELSRLIDAMKGDPERLALTLLGAEAGLRQGESMALQWGDVDLVAGVLMVRRSSWQGLIGTHKHGIHRPAQLWTAGGHSAAHDSVRPTDLLRPVGIPAVLAASQLRSSGPYWRIRSGLQLAASR